MQQCNNKNDSALFSASNLHQKNSEQGYNSAFARLHPTAQHHIKVVSSIVNHPSEKQDETALASFASM